MAFRLGHARRLEMGSIRGSTPLGGSGEPALARWRRGRSSRRAPAEADAG